MGANVQPTRLSDVQLVLLSTAVNRPDGSLLPPPVTFGSALSARIRKAIATLLRRGLAEERKTAHGDQIWREDDDPRFGLFLTDAGRVVLAAEDGSVGTDGSTADSVPPVAAVTTPDDKADASSAAPEPVVEDGRADSKIAKVIALLERPEGATLLELVDATDWLPHTIRAAMTGLRQKGYAIERSSSRDNITFWYIPKPAATMTDDRQRHAGASQ
jgi:hypothetical protein